MKEVAGAMSTYRLEWALVPPPRVADKSAL